MGEKEMNFENIWFRRCGTVDKTLPGKTSEQRFISSTVGLKHSQTSWYTLTALMPKKKREILPLVLACVCIFSDTNLQ